MVTSQSGRLAVLEVRILVSVGEYLQDWLTIRAATLRPRTLEQYRAAVSQICAVIGARDLDTLTPASCAACYAPIIAAGHGRTAQICFAVLRMALRDACGMGLLQSSPAAALHRPRADARDMQPFTPDEVRRLIACDPTHRIVWQLLHATGMRRGEACGLRWCDVDFTRGSITIARQAVRAGGVVSLSVPKSASGVRCVPVPASLLAALRTHLCAQVAAGRRGDFVASADGSMLDPSRLNKWLTAAGRAAGVTDAHPHRWRHTYGADAVSAGVPIRVLQRLLGHADISVTARYYAYVRADVLRNAADRLADYRQGVI